VSAAPAATRGGLGDALRAIGGTLADMACVRGALASVELAEEIERRKGQLVLGALGAVFVHSALLVATFLVAAIFWDTYRLIALASLALVYFAGGIGAFALMSRRARTAPEPFAATRRELEQDLAAWRQPR
jgi:uncharacterized membrane protein YqjE